jgi:hypothetical protein
MLSYPFARNIRNHIPLTCDLQDCQDIHMIHLSERANLLNDDVLVLSLSTGVRRSA